MAVAHLSGAGDGFLRSRSRELDAAQARPYLRGFNYGDEVGLQHSVPRDGRDDGLRHGPIPFQRDGQTVRCTLDLDVTDFVIVER